MNVAGTELDLKVSIFNDEAALECTADAAAAVAEPTALVAAPKEDVALLARLVALATASDAAPGALLMRLVAVSKSSDASPATLAAAEVAEVTTLATLAALEVATLAMLATEAPRDVACPMMLPIWAETSKAEKWSTETTRTRRKSPSIFGVTISLSAAGGYSTRRSKLSKGEWAMSVSDGEAMGNRCRLMSY